MFRAEMFCAKHVPTHDSSALSPAPPPPPPPPPRSVQPVDKIAMFLPKAASATSSVKWIDYPSSLQELLSMPPRFSSLECFERFAVSEYSTENIFFWREIQQFKSRHHHPKLKAYWYTASAPTADDAELLIEPYFDEDRQLEMCSSARAIFCKYLIVDAQFEVQIGIGI